MNEFLLAIIALIVIAYFLRKEGFTTRHTWGLILAVAWAFLFFTYGGPIIQNIFPTVSASSFFLTYLVVVGVGTALLTALPLWNAGMKLEARKAFLAIIAVWLLYVVVDAVGFGPAAVGPNSPYQGQDLCSLNPTYYSEDVAFGCYVLQPLGVAPYSPMASLVTYILFPAALLLIAMRILGIKKVEKVIFNGQ